MTGAHAQPLPKAISLPFGDTALSRSFAAPVVRRIGVAALAVVTKISSLTWPSASARLVNEIHPLSPGNAACAALAAPSMDAVKIAAAAVLDALRRFTFFMCNRVIPLSP